MRFEKIVSLQLKGSSLCQAAEIKSKVTMIRRPRQSGKSTLVVETAMSLASQGKKVVCFSPQYSQMRCLRKKFPNRSDKGPCNTRQYGDNIFFRSAAAGFDQEMHSMGVDLIILDDCDFMSSGGAEAFAEYIADRFNISVLATESVTR